MPPDAIGTALVVAASMAFMAWGAVGIHVRDQQERRKQEEADRRRRCASVVDLVDR